MATDSKDLVTLELRGNPVTCFVRIHGLRGGMTRELLAAVSPTSRYSVMRRTDAAGLGLATTNFPRPYPGTGTLEVAGSLEGISEHEVIKIPRMALGPLEATGVEAMLVEYSMPETIGVDVILGGTFFSGMKVVMDYPRGLLTIESRTRARTRSAWGHRRS